MPDLVVQAYGATTNPGSRGAEYVRMLIQVRNGFPLSEEFFKDTSKLRKALEKRQSPEIETLIIKVSEMLFHGKDPHPEPKGYPNPDDNYFTGQ